MKAVPVLSKCYTKAMWLLSQTAALGVNGYVVYFSRLRFINLVLFTPVILPYKGALARRYNK